MFACARRGSITLALVLVLAELSSASAQAIPGGSTPIAGGRGIRRTTRLFVVDAAPGSCRFSGSIQAAVDAAGEGDVVLVKAGLYDPFVVDGKAVSVIGEGRPRTRVEVKNLQVGQTVVVRGFGIDMLARFSDDAGCVWLEDCEWEGDYYDPGSLSSTNSEVGFFRCRSAFPFFGLSATNGSTIFGYHSLFVGAAGNDADYDDRACRDGSCYGYEVEAGKGASGIRLSAASQAYLSACSVVGGYGGAGYVMCDFCPGCLRDGCGGDGLTLVNSTATALDSSFAGGPGPTVCRPVSCVGTPIFGAGLTTVPLETGEYWIDSPIEAGAPVTFHARGPSGWKVFVRASSECVPGYSSVFHGYALLPISLPSTFLGVLPASGELDVTQSFGNLLEPGAEARVLYLQADFYDPITEITVLGTPSALVVYRDPCP